VGDRDDRYFGGGMYGTSGLGVDYAETPIDGSNAGNNLILPGVVEDHYTFGLDDRFTHWALGMH
jgi:long-chain fatty acid transport protein